MNTDKKNKLEVVIIGAGILARVSSWRLSRLGISHKVLVPTSSSTYIIHNSVNDEQRNVVFKDLGHSLDWGNQHDVGIREFWEPTKFSDLPGFPFLAPEIAGKENEINDFFRIKKFKESPKNDVFASWLDIPKIHIKGRRKNIESDYPISSDNQIRFQATSLEFSRIQDEGFEIEYRDEANAISLLSTSTIMLATGGLGNLAFAKKIYQDFGVNPPPGLGIGYSNHPKSLIFQIKLLRYTRTKVTERRLDKEWKSFLVFDKSIDSENQRGPRVSLRFWRLSAKSFLSESSIDANLLIRLFDKAMRTLGFTRFMSAVAYFEMPQFKGSKLEVINDSNGISILQTVERNQSLETYYGECVSILRAILLANPSVLELVQTDINYSEFTLQDSHHYMGTTRMAENPTFGAVDKWGELFHLPGVYCVGTSIIPVSAVNHPTYLASVLSLRTVERISEVLKK